jgi:hypothetical protein
MCVHTYKEFHVKKEGRDWSGTSSISQETLKIVSKLSETRERYKTDTSS